MRTIALVALLMSFGFALAQSRFAVAFFDDMVTRINMVEVDCPPALVHGIQTGLTLVDPPTDITTRCYAVNYSFRTFQTLWANDLRFRKDEGLENPMIRSAWKHVLDSYYQISSRGREGFLVHYFSSGPLVAFTVAEFE